MYRFVEYETAADLKTAVEKLDNREFKGQAVRCLQEVSSPPPPPPFKPRHPYGGPGPDDRGRDRYRSRSPVGRRGYPPAPYDDYHDRRGPPRGYSPRRDDYRRRTPPRDFYETRERYGRMSPRGRGPVDEYGPPRARYPEDPYDARGPPPRRGYEPDPYANGHGRPYEPRAPSPRGRPRSPPGSRPGYEEPYPPRRYW